MMKRYRRVLRRTRAYTRTGRGSCLVARSAESQSGHGFGDLAARKPGRSEHGLKRCGGEAPIEPADRSPERNRQEKARVGTHGHDVADTHRPFIGLHDEDPTAGTEDPQAFLQHGVAIRQ